MYQNVSQCITKYHTYDEYLSYFSDAEKTCNITYWIQDVIKWVPSQGPSWCVFNKDKLHINFWSNINTRQTLICCSLLQVLITPLMKYKHPIPSMFQCINTLIRKILLDDILIYPCILDLQKVCKQCCILNDSGQQAEDLWVIKKKLT